MSHAFNSAVFTVHDCALITLSTGSRARTLREFRTELIQVPVGCIYHHCWGRLLRPQFDEPEYNNDFASWAYHALHDKPLAERLSMVIPTNFNALEDLRQGLIDVVEMHLDETGFAPSVTADQDFHFMKAQIVVFDTGLRFESPTAMLPYLANLSTSSIYYHFIDARSRTADQCDDFSNWLCGFNDTYAPLAQALRGLDPYFSSLKEIRQQLVGIFEEHCLKD